MLKLPIDSISLALIAAPCSLGSTHPGCAEGPAALKKSALLAELSSTTEWLEIHGLPGFGGGLLAIPQISAFCTALAEKVFQCLKQKRPFITIGGDHSCAIGTWSGVAAAFRHKGPVGLIWVDAHMDAHTANSSITGNPHGMPVAALLGHGDQQLTTVYGDFIKILPQHLCLIGVRSYEAEERSLLESLGVRIYYMEEVENRGLHTVMQEALQTVNRGTAGFGISIDLDGIDPLDAPGTGIHEKNGLSGQQLLECLKYIKNFPNFIAAEITEFNPTFEVDNRTEQLMVQIIAELASALTRRKNFDRQNLSV